jgi:hypothetical protein
MDFEFCGFLPTPGEKHIGIVKIKAFNKIVLRYKIIAKKDGNGYFPTAASYKVAMDGQDTYVPAFILDSNSDKDDLENLIRTNLRKFLADSATSTTQVSGNSALCAPGSFLPDPNEVPF